MFGWVRRRQAIAIQVEPSQFREAFDDKTPVIDLGPLAVFGVPIARSLPHGNG